MISREAFIDSVRAEVAIIKHLYSKVSKSDPNYRPSAKQRSLEELLAYIPCTAAAAPFFLSGDMSTIRASMDKIEADSRRDFIGTLDREIEKFITLVKSFKDSDFETREATLPTGQKVKLGSMLLNFGLKFFTGYRMQLFTYLKAEQPELGTINCWMGMDSMPPKK